MYRIHDAIAQQIRNLNASNLVETFLIGFFDFIILGILAITLDLILKNFFQIIAKRVVNKTKFNWDDILYKNRVFNSLSHFVSISIIILLTSIFIPETYNQLNKFINNILYIVFILIFIQFVTRVIDSVVTISTSENNHRTIAVRSFAQLLKIMTYLFSSILLISIILEQDISVIIGSLSALTAIIILVFKDSILGFVSGVQIASTKMIKVGDWISISKHKVDGIVIEINLVSAKIQNWDKTISSVPTYDLISSSVKSYEPMIAMNVRRIKRSLIFNIKSFAFIENSELENFKRFELIESYINTKQNEIENENINNKKSDKSIINRRRLTNIGVFRKYTELYLKNNPKINQNQTLLVRQLDPTPHGLPLEIYCFTNSSKWNAYEEIQSDIFDHLLTSSKEFNLEVVQVLTN